MENPLLNPDVQDFITGFEGDLTRLSFSKSPFPNVKTGELVSQIQARRSLEKKLPTWVNSKNILYPPKINLEQTSSEITANYKSGLVRGKTIADITGGFGVDSYFFSKKFQTVHHFETDEKLSRIAENNLKNLGAASVHFFAEDGLKGIQNKNYDVIYADPSRRHKKKGKVYYLQDSEPDIPSNLSMILSHCSRFMLKTSPMLDISTGLKELSGVSEIHIVAVSNEVKELIWIMSSEGVEDIKVHTVNFTKNRRDSFAFFRGSSAEASYSSPKKYLYDPNAAIRKSGAFNLLSKEFNLDKLDKNTHLYTSDNLIEFPGRRFLIEEVIPYKKSEIRKKLNLKQANINARNFPETVDILKKKWKISDGGSHYLFFTTTPAGKFLLICSKA